MLMHYVWTTPATFCWNNILKRSSELRSICLMCMQPDYNDTAARQSFAISHVLAVFNPMFDVHSVCFMGLQLPPTEHLHQWLSACELLLCYCGIAAIQCKVWFAEWAGQSILFLHDEQSYCIGSHNHIQDHIASGHYILKHQHLLYVCKSHCNWNMREIVSWNDENENLVLSWILSEITLLLLNRSKLASNAAIKFESK